MFFLPYFTSALHLLILGSFSTLIYSLYYPLRYLVCPHANQAKISIVLTKCSGLVWSIPNPLPQTTNSESGVSKGSHTASWSNLIGVCTTVLRFHSSQATELVSTTNLKPGKDEYRKLTEYQPVFGIILPIHTGCRDIDSRPTVQEANEQE